MSTEYTAKQLSDLREEQMVGVACRKGLRLANWADLERQAFEGHYRRKKSRPDEIKAAPVLSVAS